MGLPAKLQLGRRADGTPIEWDCGPPASYAARYDIAAALGRSTHRAAAAAVGLCCPRLARELRVSYTGDALKYGGDVIDAYMRQIAGSEGKVKGRASDLVAAGAPLLTELLSDLVSEDEVADAEGFSAAPPDGATS